MSAYLNTILGVLTIAFGLFCGWYGIEYNQLYPAAMGGLLVVMGIWVILNEADDTPRGPLA